MAASGLAQPIRNSSRRRANIHHRDNPFQPVVAGLVKEVADTDHPRRFAREVDRKPRGGAAEDASDGIQFLPTASKIRVRHGKVCRIQTGDRHEKIPVLLVPEMMRARRWRRTNLDRRCQIR